jgi:lipopolysaccharide exporter
MSSIGRQIARGGLWMLLFKVADRVLAIVGMAILARVLTPADFGLVAMATVVIEAIELATTFGFDIALLRDPTVDRSRYNSAWSLNLLLALFCAGVLLLLTYPAAGFYEEPKLLTLMPLLALGMAVRGLENIGTVDFRRQLDFRKEFIFMTSKRVGNFLAAVLLALWLRSYWALAWSIVISRAIGVLLSYRLADYRPSFELSQAKPLFHFSKWLLFTNFIGFLQSRLPDFLIGRIAGPHHVGLYATAADIARMPTTEIVAPINRAVYPGYARQGNDLAALSSTYLAVVGAIWTLALPAAVGLALVAQPFVMLFLGEKWVEMAGTVRVLAVAGFFTLIVSNQYYVYLAIGRASIVTRLALLQLVVMLIGAVSLAPRFGILGVAYAVLIAAAVDAPVSFVIFKNVTKTSWNDVWHTAWRPVLATGAMALVLLQVYPDGVRAPDEVRALGTLMSAAALGAVCYFASLVSAWVLANKPEGPEEQLLRVLRAKFAKPSADSA